MNMRSYTQLRPIASRATERDRAAVRRAAFDTYWREVIEPIMADVTPYVGRSLGYLVTDSWELGGVNWTEGFREGFRARRGYDLLPYLPVVTGRIIESREASGYFLNDLRRTVGDLVAQNHYAVFAEHAKSKGLGIHPESGGPHGAPIDSLQLLGMDAMPQTEFWAPSPHRPTEQDRFFVKEASSAAHIYGKRVVAAEGLTSLMEAMRPYWMEQFGDAPSIHIHGQAAHRAVDHARETLAAFFNCREAEVVFNSGGTEGDNTAIFGLLRPGDHFITTSIEHSAVLQAANRVAERGVEVTFIAPQPSGQL